MSDAVIRPPDFGGAGASACQSEPSSATSSSRLSSRARARLRFWATFLLFLSLLAAASFAVYRYRQSQPAALLPSAPARQGDFLVLIRCRGELKAERSVQIYTPDRKSVV